MEPLAVQPRPGLLLVIPETSLNLTVINSAALENIELLTSDDALLFVDECLQTPGDRAVAVVVVAVVNARDVSGVVSRLEGADAHIIYLRGAGGPDELDNIRNEVWRRCTLLPHCVQCTLYHGGELAIKQLEVALRVDDTERVSGLESERGQIRIEISIHIVVD